MDVLPHLCSEAGISGRDRRPRDREHGRAVQRREVCEGSLHEPGARMKTLHVDTGRRMQGGQWQVLYLLERLEQSRLLAPTGSPLLEAARRRGIDTEEFSVWRMR